MIVSHLLKDKSFFEEIILLVRKKSIVILDKLFGISKNKEEEKVTNLNIGQVYGIAGTGCCI